MNDICAVADAGPIIHLGELNALELFTEFETVYVPETVITEIEEGGLPAQFDEVGFTSVDVAYSSDEYPQLDPGETAAVVLCNDLEAVLLTDDMAAREIAATDGLEVHGSIGILLSAYSQQLITKDETKGLIRGLKRDTSLYLSSSLVEYGIQLLDETEHR